MTIQPLTASPSLTALARTDTPEPTAPRAAVAPPKSGDGFTLGSDPASAFSRFADTELWGKKKPKAKPSPTPPASQPTVKATAAPSPAEVAESKRTETMKQIKTEFGLGDLRDGDAKWTTGELAALKLTLGNLPSADRAKLKDVSFVRDHAKEARGTKATEIPGAKAHENPAGNTQIDFDTDADGRRTGKSATIRMLDEAFPSDLEIQSYDRRSTFPSQSSGDLRPRLSLARSGGSDLQTQGSPHPARALQSENGEYVNSSGVYEATGDRHAWARRGLCFLSAPTAPALRFNALSLRW